MDFTRSLMCRTNAIRIIRRSTHTIKRFAMILVVRASDSVITIFSLRVLGGVLIAELLSAVAGSTNASFLLRYLCDPHAGAAPDFNTSCFETVPSLIQVRSITIVTC